MAMLWKKSQRLHFVLPDIFINCFHITLFGIVLYISITNSFFWIYNIIMAVVA